MIFNGYLLNLDIIQSMKTSHGYADCRVSNAFLDIQPLFLFMLPGTEKFSDRRRGLLNLPAPYTLTSTVFPCFEMILLQKNDHFWIFFNKK